MAAEIPRTTTWYLAVLFLTVDLGQLQVCTFEKGQVAVSIDISRETREADYTRWIIK